MCIHIFNVHDGISMCETVTPICPSLEYSRSWVLNMGENKPNLGSDYRIPVRKPPLKQFGSGM